MKAWHKYRYLYRLDLDMHCWCCLVLGYLQSLGVRGYSTGQAGESSLGAVDGGAEAGAAGRARGRGRRGRRVRRQGGRCGRVGEGEGGRRSGWSPTEGAHAHRVLSSGRDGCRVLASEMGVRHDAHENQPRPHTNGRPGSHISHGDDDDDYHGQTTITGEGEVTR